MPSEISQILLRLAPIKITDHWEYQSATHGRDLRTEVLIPVHLTAVACVCLSQYTTQKNWSLQLIYRGDQQLEHC